MSHPSAPPSAGALFDLRAITEILQGADATRVVDLLIEGLTRYAAALDSALRASDWAGAVRAAHTIAGAAANVSATQVVALARELEDLDRDSRPARAGGLGARLVDATAALIASLNDWRRAHTAG